MDKKFRRKSKFKKPLAYLSLVVLVFATIIASLVWWYWGGQSKKPFRAGVTFSTKYAKELGLDPKQTMTALVDDLGVRHFRLMSYWDVLEAERGIYNFDDLDWQMQLAERSGSKVSLAIGLRQPRWPECHTPAWAKQLAKDDKRTLVLSFMQATVNRYKNSSALESYQLENEALNTAFGECSDFDRVRLENEFKAVKSWDKYHPIIVSVSNEFGLPIGKPRGDEVGFSIYHRVFDSNVTHKYVEYPIPAWYHGLRAAIIKLLTSRDTIIHELQAEPWGPKPTNQLTIAEQSESMDVARLKGRVGYAKATGIRDFDLWGAEWWYWRKTKFNDDSLWQAAKPFFAPALQTKDCCK